MDKDLVNKIGEILVGSIILGGILAFLAGGVLFLSIAWIIHHFL